MSARDPRDGPIASPFAHSERSAYSTSSSSIGCRSSVRIVARRFVKPKKSSARRKKPRIVLRFQTSLSAAPSAHWAPSVASAPSSAEPTAGSLAAAAIPSSRVDFPEPFSPTKKVTAVSNESDFRCRMAGTENGKVRSSPRDFRLISRRKTGPMPCASDFKRVLSCGGGDWAFGILRQPSRFTQSILQTSHIQ